MKPKIGLMNRYEIIWRPMMPHEGPMNLRKPYEIESAWSPMKPYEAQLPRSLQSPMSPIGYEPYDASWALWDLWNLMSHLKPYETIWSLMKARWALWYPMTLNWSLSAFLVSVLITPTTKITNQISSLPQQKLPPKYPHSQNKNCHPNILIIRAETATQISSTLS